LITSGSGTLSNVHHSSMLLVINMTVAGGHMTYGILAVEIYATDHSVAVGSSMQYKNNCTDITLYNSKFS